MLIALETVGDPHLSPTRVDAGATRCEHRDAPSN
jgi:hypothetical protein